MRILMVAIPNHHFFQWVDQLKNSGYDVYWFDITDGGAKVDRIDWVTQGKGWKLKWDFPFRHSIKAYFPRLYNAIQKVNDRSIDNVFQQLIEIFQPDVVHCFEMRLAGFPILKVLEQNTTLDFIYSSWGSDLFFFEELGVNKIDVQRFLKRVNYLITDCKRDYEIATQNGFSNTFLGDYIGNGGLAIHENDILPLNSRNTIIIKGYEDGVGKAIPIIEAIESLPLNLFSNIEIVIYSADAVLKERIESSSFFKQLKVTIYVRGEFIANSDLLKIMGQSKIHIANSISDGLPTSSVEAMGMGAFPIQSNPGRVSEEVITNGKNGFLIENPMDTVEIANLVKRALLNDELRARTQDFNVDFVNKNYNKEQLKIEILDLYQKIKENQST